MNALTQEKKKKEVVASAPTTSTQKFDVNKWSFVKVRKWKADSSSEIGCILWKIYKRSIQWHFHHIVLHCVTLCSLKASTVNMIYFLHFTFWSFLQYSLGIWGLVGPARSPRAQKAKVLCAADFPNFSKVAFDRWPWCHVTLATVSRLDLLHNYPSIWCSFQFQYPVLKLTV